MMMLPLLPLKLIKSINNCLNNIQLTDFACFKNSDWLTTIGQNVICCKSDSHADPILTPAVRDDDAASSAFETDQIHQQLPQQHSID